MTALPQPPVTAFDEAVAAHDARIASLGLDLWIGNEPTFTDRHSHATEWQTGALGPEKEKRAEKLLAVLARDNPGAVLLRTVGRLYPGEETARWCLGLYAARDASVIWTGPPDPLLTPAHALAASPRALGAFGLELAKALRRHGFGSEQVGDAREMRIAAFVPPAMVAADDPRLRRLSRHENTRSSGAAVDDLAAEGIYLFLLDEVSYPLANEAGEAPRQMGVPAVEMPAFPSVALMRQALDAIAEAARQAGLSTLVLRGAPPPVDASVRWMTLTPDPAVVEVNAAPESTVTAFLASNRRTYQAAAEVGLAPFRLYYNGVVADSGGAGQITMGGPSPADSPFFRAPQLLPRLLTYVQQHPSLSYLFAHEYVGPSGQSVRPDERGTDALDELRLALALLERVGASCSPLTLWSSLGPCLADATGNSHRAELNIEKLWNPHLPARGQLGLVEVRAFRMQATPERAAALAALLRATLARLVIGHPPGALVDWGRTLHERFALPFHLHADLAAVLADLREAGVGLGVAIEAELTRDDERLLCRLHVAGAEVVIRRAIETWPLVGDASAQQGTSRLVDASTARLEISVRPDRAAGEARWELRAQDVVMPLRREQDERGPVDLLGLRYRTFVPAQGLHPTLGAQTPLRLTLLPPDGPRCFVVTLHEWRPDAGAYAGLPADLEEAQRRRAERCVLSEVPREALAPRIEPVAAACGDYCLDLRYPPRQAS